MSVQKPNPISDLDEFFGIDEIPEAFKQKQLDGRGHQFTPEQRRANLENNIAMQADRGEVLKRANGENAHMADGLNGDLDPAWNVARELPVHRTMINMAVAGYKTIEISKLTGYSVNSISNLLRQPWARKYIVEQAKQTVQAEIKKLLEQEALPSLQTLVDVRDGSTSKPAERTNAANALLDRFMGKPMQPINVSDVDPASMSEEELRRAVESELNNKSN